MLQGCSVISGVGSNSFSGIEITDKVIPVQHSYNPTISTLFQHYYSETVYSQHDTISDNMLYVTDTASTATHPCQQSPEYWTPGPNHLSTIMLTPTLESAASIMVAYLVTTLPAWGSSGIPVLLQLSTSTPGWFWDCIQTSLS